MHMKEALECKDDATLQEFLHQVKNILGKYKKLQYQQWQDIVYMLKTLVVRGFDFTANELKHVVAYLLQTVKVRFEGVLPCNAFVRGLCARHIILSGIRLNALKLPKQMHCTQNTSSSKIMRCARGKQNSLTYSKIQTICWTWTKLLCMEWLERRWKCSAEAHPDMAEGSLSLHANKTAMWLQWWSPPPQEMW